MHGKPSYESIVWRPLIRVFCVRLLCSSPTELQTTATCVRTTFLLFVSWFGDAVHVLQTDLGRRSRTQSEVCRRRSSVIFRSDPTRLKRTTTGSGTTSVEDTHAAQFASEEKQTPNRRVRNRRVVRRLSMQVGSPSTAHRLSTFVSSRRL